MSGVLLILDWVSESLQPSHIFCTHNHLQSHSRNSSANSLLNKRSVIQVDLQWEDSSNIHFQTDLPTPNISYIWFYSDIFLKRETPLPVYLSSLCDSLLSLSQLDHWNQAYSVIYPAYYYFLAMLILVKQCSMWGNNSVLLSSVLQIICINQCHKTNNTCSGLFWSMRATFNADTGTISGDLAVDWKV